VFEVEFRDLSIAVIFISLSIAMAPIAWIIRDRLARQLAAENEVARQALRYIARNTNNDPATRRKAQMALSSYPRVTMRHNVKDKCVEHGRSKVRRRWLWSGRRWGLL
jgi:small subunit ribosomal protein S14